VAKLLEIITECSHVDNQESKQTKIYTALAFTTFYKH
jgi:hypothetical protein